MCGCVMGGKFWGVRGFEWVGVIKNVVKGFGVNEGIGVI